MSKSSNRYGTYKSTGLPREKRSILLPGSLDDNGRYYKCWNCGVTCDSQREQTDTGQYAVSGVSVESNLSLLLHMNGTNGSTTFTDSSPNSHTVTTGGSSIISTSQYKFGDSSGYFTGSSDLLSIPDNSVFNFSDGVWSISFWIRGAWTATSDETIYTQTSGATDYFSILILGDASGHGVKLSIVKDSTEIISLSTGTPRLVTNTWHYVEISEWNDLYMISVDGNMRWKTESTSRPANYTDSVYVGGIVGYLDEFTIMRYVTHFGGFDIPTAAYDTDTYIPGTYYPNVNGGCWFCGSRNYR
jgi:hypothetical protein